MNLKAYKLPLSAKMLLWVVGAQVAIMSIWPQYAFAAVAPSFQAVLSVDQTVVPNTSTLLNFNTLLFDNNSGFNTTTHVWTPPLAGTYLITLFVECNGTGTTNCTSRIRKNGVSYALSGSVMLVAGASFTNVNAIVVATSSTSFSFEVINVSSTGVSSGNNVTFVAASMLPATDGVITLAVSTTSLSLATTTSLTVDNATFDYFMGVILLFVGLFGTVWLFRKRQ